MITALVTVLIFLLLISLHEFGHFISAKLSGVSVLEFAVGMGPQIFRKQGKNTLYTIRLFPVGGYCKLEGEDEESDSPNAFNNQKLYKRIIVIISGALLNFVLGYCLIILMVLAQPHDEGEPNLINTPVIDSILAGSNLENSGIKSGDKIVSINGHKINFYNDIPLYTDEFEQDEEVNISVKRDDKKLSFNIMPTLREETYIYGEENVQIITKINGVTTTTTAQYNEDNSELIDEYVGKTTTQESLIIGFVPKAEEVGINNIFSYSFHYTGYIVRMVYNALWDMVTGKTGFGELSGPVGIVATVNTAVNTGKYSVVNVLMLAALLSVNLGVFNLLPLPALDGGRLFFLLIELVRGKPIESEKEGMIHAVGLFLLLALAVVISFNDIIKLIK